MRCCRFCEPWACIFLLSQRRGKRKSSGETIRLLGFDLPDLGLACSRNVLALIFEKEQHALVKNKGLNFSKYHETKKLANSRFILQAQT